MGKCRAGIITPSWTHDLRSMLKVCGEPGHSVIVRCLKCFVNRALERDDFDRLLKAKGEAFSLFNKRTRCRLTSGCEGWNVFGYTHGPWVYPLYDEGQLERWGAIDQESERRTRAFMVEALRSHPRNVEADKARKRH